MTDLTIDGETFRVEVEGDPARPVLLLASSLGAGLTMWDAQMPAFLQHFRVVRYDPRGHGGSTRAGAPYSLARLGGDALAILDALGIERAHIVGISMGGAVAQWLLVNAPERVDRAVLVCTNARFAPPQLWNERIGKVLSHGTQALASVTMERWFSEGFRASHADVVAATEKVFRATSAEGYAAAAAALRDMDMREALRSVERPVLVVTGRDDGIASPADIAGMLSAIAGARHVELDCKHISNIEAQADFDAAVIAFLTGPVPARARKPREVKPKAVAKPATRRPAGRTILARSPLKRTRAVAPPERRPRPADPTRAAAKPARKAAPRKAARPGATRRASPVAARAPVEKAAAKTPARKTKTAATKTPATTKPRRATKASTATRKAVAKKAVTKKAVTKKAATKKPVTKKVPAKKVAAKTRASSAPTKPAKPGARRTTKKRPGRPGPRGRR
jgi:3-oxoadipate enol-lactonase